jgi:hypothetical protein
LLEFHRRIPGTCGDALLSATQSSFATGPTARGRGIERDYPALLMWWRMIFSENRYPLFGIML